MSITTATGRQGHQLLAPDGPPAPSTRRRERTYRVVVLALAVLVLAGPGGAVGLLAPWSTVGHHAGAGYELHRWHTTDIAAYASLLVAGSLLASLRRPRRSTALVQTALASALWLGVFSWLMPSPVAAVVPAAAIVALIVSTYPDRRALGRIPDWSGPPMARLAAGAATPLLLWNGWQNLERQLSGAGEHAELGHWAGAAALALALLVAGWLGASLAPGARRLCVVVAATYAHLGAAALALPNHDGSWGTTGGVLALALAALFLLSTRARRDQPAVRR